MPDSQLFLAAGYEIGAGRLVPTVAAAVGLAGVVLGRLALVRRGRATTVAALTLGLVGAAVGAVHAAGSQGGLGTGNGLAGAVVAVVLGLIAAAMGGVALTRARRTP